MSREPRHSWEFALLLFALLLFTLSLFTLSLFALSLLALLLFTLLLFALSLFCSFALLLFCSFALLLFHSFDLLLFAHLLFALLPLSRFKKSNRSDSLLSLFTKRATVAIHSCRSLQKGQRELHHLMRLYETGVNQGPAHAHVYPL